MQRKELYENLCYYDRRSPEFEWCTKDMTAEEIKSREKSCSCDPCHEGRHKLADYALDILEQKEDAERENNLHD